VFWLQFSSSIHFHRDVPGFDGPCDPLDGRERINREQVLRLSICLTDLVNDCIQGGSVDSQQVLRRNAVPMFEKFGPVQYFRAFVQNKTVVCHWKPSPY